MNTPYQNPVCHDCGNALVVIDQHIHEYSRRINASGKVGITERAMFRHVHNDTLKCSECGQLYVAKRDDSGRYIRGRKIRG